MMYVAIPAAPRLRRVPLNGTDESAPLDWGGLFGKGAILAGVLILISALGKGRK